MHLSEDRKIHRSILGEEALSLAGWPTRRQNMQSMVSERSNAFLQDLAGNAFPSTCIAAVLAALFFAADECSASVQTDDGDVSEAMALMDACRPSTGSSSCGERGPV